MGEIMETTTTSSEPPVFSFHFTSYIRGSQSDFLIRLCQWTHRECQGSILRGINPLFSGREKCLCRTLWCHSQVDLWPYMDRVTSLFHPARDFFEMFIIIIVWSQRPEQLTTQIWSIHPRVQGPNPIHSLPPPLGPTPPFCLFMPRVQVPQFLLG